MTKNLSALAIILLLISQTVFGQGLFEDKGATWNPLHKNVKKTNNFGVGNSDPSQSYIKKYDFKIPDSNRFDRKKFNISNNCPGERNLFVSDECDIQISFQVTNLVNTALEATSSTLDASCFNAKKGECDENPGPYEVCGCLSAKSIADKFSASSHKGWAGKGVGEGATQSNPVLENIQGKVDDATKTDLKMKISESLRNCDHFSEGTVEKEECLKSAVESLTKDLTSKDVKRSIKNRDHGINLADSNEKKRFDDLKLCLDQESYLKNDIPSSAAMKLININSVSDAHKGKSWYMNPKQSLTLNIRNTIIKGLLEGKTAFEAIDLVKSNYKGDDKAVAQIEEYFQLNGNYDAVESLGAFFHTNSYWKELAKDGSMKKEDVFDHFLEIYTVTNPSELGKKIEAFRDGIAKNAVDEAKKNEANLKASLEKIQNDKEWLFYSDFSLANETFEAQKKLNPDVMTPRKCEMISNLMRGKTYYGMRYSPQITIEQLEGCEKTYKVICSGLSKVAKAEAGTKEEKEIIEQGVKKLKAERNVMRSNFEEFFQAGDKICGDKKNKMAKISGLKKEMTRSEFKEALCNSNKQIGSIPQELKAEACSNGKNSEFTLSDLYASSFLGSDSADIFDDTGDSISLSTKLVSNKRSDINYRNNTDNVKDILEAANSTTSETYSDQDGNGLLAALKQAAKKAGNDFRAGQSGEKIAIVDNGKSFGTEFFGGLDEAAKTISNPAVNSNVQSFMDGKIPVNNILPANFVDNSDSSQISAAKSSIDNGVEALEKKLAAVEKQEQSSRAKTDQTEMDLLRQQITELKAQSDMLKSELDKEKASKVANTNDPKEVSKDSVERAPANFNESKSGASLLPNQTTQSTQQLLQQSKTFPDLFNSDSSLHGIPTIKSSSSIDSKAFSSRSSNDALLSIYSDKEVSSLVNSVSSPSNNILVVGNALEMKQTTVDERKFPTKEILVNQKQLDQVRSNPDILRSLIEKNDMKNHVGILTLKNGESQLNYMMRKDDAGKVVILPLNIARSKTLKNLQEELMHQ